GLLARIEDLQRPREGGPGRGRRGHRLLEDELEDARLAHLRHVGRIGLRARIAGALEDARVAASVPAYRAAGRRRARRAGDEPAEEHGNEPESPSAHDAKHATRGYALRGGLVSPGTSFDRPLTGVRAEPLGAHGLRA